jgi:acyl phosphate:glycerol-3-phosphate acyltransferase
MALQLIMAALFAYLLGAIPTAYIIGRINGINILKVGSGNMGATNVLRTLGLKWAAAVGVVDVLKAVFAVVIARALVPDNRDAASVVSGVAAIVGHNWSIFVYFLTGALRGGKGGACSAGTWLMLFGAWPLLIVAPLVAFAVLLYATRYVSFSVLTTGVIAAGLALGGIAFGTPGMPPLYALYVLPMLALLFYQHRQNIERLRTGTERRIGERERAPAAPPQ